MKRKIVKKRCHDFISDDDNQDSKYKIPMDTENGNQDLRCNILDRKKKIKKNSYKFRMHEKDNDKNFSNCKSSYTKTKPVVAFSHKPACFLQNKQQMFAAFLPDIKEFIHEYLSEMIQKKLKENLNVEINEGALINEFGISKQINKPEIMDNTSSANLRPISSKRVNDSHLQKYNYREKSEKIRSVSNNVLKKSKKNNRKSSRNASSQNSKFKSDSSKPTDAKSIVEKHKFKKKKNKRKSSLNIKLQNAESKSDSSLVHSSSESINKMFIIEKNKKFNDKKEEKSASMRSVSNIDSTKLKKKKCKSGFNVRSQNFGSKSNGRTEHSRSVSIDTLFVIEKDKKFKNRKKKRSVSMSSASDIDSTKLKKKKWKSNFYARSQDFVSKSNGRTERSRSTSIDPLFVIEKDKKFKNGKKKKSVSMSSASDIDATMLKKKKCKSYFQARLKNSKSLLSNGGSKRSRRETDTRSIVEGNKTLKRQKKRSKTVSSVSDTDLVMYKKNPYILNLNKSVQDNRSDISSTSSSIDYKIVKDRGEQLFDKVLDRRFDEKFSGRLDYNGSRVTTVDIPPHLSNRKENKCVLPSLLKNGSLNKYYGNYDNKTLNCQKFQNNPFDENIANYSDFSNATDSQPNGNNSDEVASYLKRQNSGSAYSEMSTIDLLFTNNELINQWIDDWSSLNKSVDKLNKTSNHSSDNNGSNGLQMKKKHFNEQLNNDVIVVTQHFLDRQSKLYDETNCSTTINKNVHTFSKEQDGLCEIESIDSTMLSNNKRSQFDIHSVTPWNSMINTTNCTTYNSSNLVDCSTYENLYFNYNDEDYGCYLKSTDSQEWSTSQILKPIQVGNVFEFCASDYIDNDFWKNELLNENITVIVPDDENETVKKKLKKLEDNNNRLKKLYEQYLHRNPNAIRCPTGNLIFNNVDEVVHRGASETMMAPSQGNVADNDNNDNCIIPIPLQARFYLDIEHSSNIYITSDDYMAYFAPNIKCLVHMAVYSTNIDGEENRGIRHCFYLYENSLVKEFWFIPYYSPNNDNAVDSGCCINIDRQGMVEEDAVLSVFSDLNIETDLLNQIENITLIILEMLLQTKNNSSQTVNSVGISDLHKETNENGVSLNSAMNLENGHHVNENNIGIMSKRNVTVDDSATIFTVINQKPLIQRLTSQVNGSVQNSLPSNSSTVSSNGVGMELFSESNPLDSVSSEQRSTEINVRVGLANRNYSLDSNLITSRAVNCPPSSSKLFQLMREILEFKHRQSMFEKARLTANSTTVNKKVFLADSSKQATTSAVNMAYVKPRLIDDVVEEEVDTDDTTVTDDLSNEN